jgi:hypothetical protein
MSKSVRRPPASGLIKHIASFRCQQASFHRYRTPVSVTIAEPPEAFDDAVHAWKTGYFEGKSVFLEPDPGKPQTSTLDTKSVGVGDASATSDVTGIGVTSHENDPASADPRVDLSTINGSQ